MQDTNERLARLETEMKEAKIELKEVKDTVTAIHNININIAVMNQNLSTLTDNFVDLKTDVEDIKQTPNKEFTMVKTVIVTAILSTSASALVTYFISQLLRPM